MLTTAATPPPTDDPWLGCNPFDPAFRDDPYPSLARLRALDPVNEMPVGIWRLTRYADVNRLLHDVPAGVRTTDGVLPGVDESLTGQRLFMLQQDPPTHTRLRRLVSSAFTPRAIAALRPQIQRIVDGCLDRVASRGTMDLIADLALPVPATVICEMMGVPVADRDRFTVWTAKATHGLASQFLPPEALAEAQAAGMALAGYFQDLIAARRATLTDDILSALIRAEEAGDRLDPPELLSQAIGLLIAGFETTIGLIGNGVRALIRHPVEIAKLRAHPELIVSAVEECLRYDGPIILTSRVPPTCSTSTRSPRSQGACGSTPRRGSGWTWSPRPSSWRFSSGSGSRAASDGSTAPSGGSRSAPSRPGFSSSARSVSGTPCS